MRMLRQLTSCYIGGSRLCADWLGPTALLLLRVWGVVPGYG